MTTSPRARPGAGRIISLYLGIGFEAHVDKLIAGEGELADYKPEKGKADAFPPRPTASRPMLKIATGRRPSRSAGTVLSSPCGSSQNCALPMTVCNTLMAAGMAKVAS